jgi:hypothetical protein
MRLAKLLTIYYRDREAYLNSLKKYEQAKAECRRLLKAQNQLPATLYSYAMKNNLKMDEVEPEYNENGIPPTMMRKCDLRKQHEEACRKAKVEVKINQLQYLKTLARLMKIEETYENLSKISKWGF